jgi:uncharacterized membrane protein (Fun14 family)
MKIVAVILTVGLMFMGGTKASADTGVISVNWHKFAGDVNKVLTTYGVEPADGWLNIQTSLSQIDMALSDGIASTVDLSATAPGGFDTFGWAAQDGTPLRTGIADWGAGSSFILSDLNATFSSYKIIVYATGFNGAGGGNQGAISDGLDTYYYTVPNPYTSSLIQSTDINIADGADDGTYVVFDNLTADTTTISLSTLNGSTGLGGFQVVGEVIPEPATMLLLGLGGLISLRRRRRK